MLRSEIPSGMCAKLRTVAASNNRDHPTRSLYYCLFAPHTYLFVLRAHPVRGESHNQRNTTGEVATLLHSIHTLAILALKETASPQSRISPHVTVKYIYIQYSEYRALTVFQGKRMLLKNPEFKKGVYSIQ